MTTLAMLAFEFPPLGGVGVQRSLKFAKYLPASGVTPVVVTTDAEALRRTMGAVNDAALLDELPPEVRVIRVPCDALRRRAGIAPGGALDQFLRVGEGIGAAWRGPLLDRWDRLVAESRPDAVYVSIPPFSIAPVAVELARRSRLPLIVDFRDHWSQWCSGPQPSWLHYRLTLARERAVLEAADAVLGVTAQLLEDLRHVHPHIPAAKFHLIPNGYDDREGVAAPMRAPRRPSVDAPFVFGYVGSFYYTPGSRETVMSPWWSRAPHRWLQYVPRREDWLYRSPYFFLRALRALLASRPELRPLVRVRFVGDTPDWLRAQVEEFGVTDVVEHLGRMPHDRCLAFQSQCDALLATSVKVVGGRDFCIAGKSFEYVASGVPIVAFVTEGEQRDFLERSGVARVCDPDDLDACVSGLTDVIDARFRPERDGPFLAQFHRRETARELARIAVALTSAQRRIA